MPFRLYLLSSWETAKKVFSIISLQRELFREIKLVLSGLGKLGNSSAERPTILNCALPHSTSIQQLSLALKLISLSGNSLIISKSFFAETVILPGLRIL